MNFRLLFGFMVTTAFLSMWISNVATTAMMIPIAQAVLEEIGTGSSGIEVPNCIILLGIF